MKREIELSIFTPDCRGKLELPLASSDVAAGFPSPAADYDNLKIDLNAELIRNAASTFFARVSGVSMVGDNVDDGDMLVVDKSIEPYDGCLAVCFLDGDFTLKRLEITSSGAVLIPSNDSYAPIVVTEENEFRVWGVVTYVIKKM